MAWAEHSRQRVRQMQRPWGSGGVVDRAMTGDADTVVCSRWSSPLWASLPHIKWRVWARRFPRPHSNSWWFCGRALLLGKAEGCLPMWICSRKYGLLLCLWGDWNLRKVAFSLLSQRKGGSCWGLTAENAHSCSLRAEFSMHLGRRWVGNEWNWQSIAVFFITVQCLTSRSPGRWQQIAGHECG